MSTNDVLLGIAFLVLSSLFTYLDFIAISSTSDEWVLVNMITMISLVALAYVTCEVWFGFGIIYLIILGIITLSIWLSEELKGIHYFMIIFLVLLSIYCICGGVNKEKDKGIAWDYTNYETIVAEYPIMGVSGENIVIKVISEEGEFLRSIPMNEIKLDNTKEVLVPYIYRENFIYTEYDYNETPPKALRQDSEDWSAYTLCGSEKQIQELFGYEVKLNFEQ